MSRTADYTIQGFMYQFNKTALEILKAQDDDKITVEGVVEDIEVVSSASLTAIQCKYHETSKSFTASMIYKPLLQMFKHFSENPKANIRYVIFAHFPEVNTTQPLDFKTILNEALSSQDKALKKYISGNPSNSDLDSFVDQFTLEFGPSYTDIIEQVCNELEASGIPNNEIETLAYPNTFHMIAELSVKHEPTERQITKKDLLSDLAAIKTTVISRWTLALKTRKKLLESRRKQLKVHLNKNVRLRYFIINPDSIEDYNHEIVLFITDYIAKYHSKLAHISTPIVCLTTGQSQINEIGHRLYAKGIIATTGYIGDRFEESYFFRDPMLTKDGSIYKREFHLRILNWKIHNSVLNDRKCDDLFIIGDPDCTKLDTIDMNVERLDGATLKELKYVLGISNVYE